MVANEKSSFIKMNFQELIEFVKHIPYGRNSNREDFSLVISENKGTCSSKHAFLKDFASKNYIPNVKLIIGIYKMSESNTKINKILSENSLNYIPEAHCYLKIDGTIVDVTSKESNFERIRNAIIEEVEIETYQVAEFKIKYHQDFIKKWIDENSIKQTFDEIWNIREQCIKQLST